MVVLVVQVAVTREQGSRLLLLMSYVRQNSLQSTISTDPPQQQQPIGTIRFGHGH